MNRLKSEKSPYLLQHVENPVDWHPWSDPAFERARTEKKLIFLSIGYSTCHWCHVMAHECFEDAEIAELLNHDYISIKVDREERPDIDQVYMEVCQRLTGSGGWPLTIFMTPDAQPFYAATYLPKHGRHGRPGMMDLLPWMTEKWQAKPALLYKASQDIVAELRERVAPTVAAPVTLELYAQAEQRLKESYDRQYGGFGQSPKFPRPHDLTFLLHRTRLTQDKECLVMVEQTLLAMRSGGIYDQIGFGFHRYATDAKWLVPHFEKMLYDQAGLALAYLDAWKMTGQELYARTVREILAYLARNMLAPEGAYFSAEDADSEGVEGKFYLWSEPEIRDVLGSDTHSFCAAFQLRPEGNYHDEMTGKLTGNNILHLTPSLENKSGMAVLLEQSTASRMALLAVREKRIRPHLDDKIITAWNGMVITALAEAGRVLGETDYLVRAACVADFILLNMRNQDGRLWRRYRLGDAAIPAFAEDYAFLARGLLDLYAANFSPLRLEQAVEIATMLRQYFQDPANGQLFDTASDAEQLLIRPASSFDGATPSASSIALEVFARLFLLTGDSAWQACADQLLQSLAADLARYPAGYTQLLQSASWLIQPTREVAIVGTPGDSTTEAMLAVARNAHLQQTVVLFKAENDPEAINRLAPFLRELHKGTGRAAAYVCQNFTCRQALNDAQELQKILNSLPD